jgi:branched-subunit amino acid ABC-type transport system permease component
MQIAISIVYFTLIYLIIAKSYQLTYLSSGFFQLTHAVVIAIGAYFVYWFHIQLDLNLLLSVLFSVALSSLIGWGTDYFVYRLLRRRMKGNMEQMIASLGLFVILQNAISTIWGDRVLSFRSWSVNQTIGFGNANISLVQLITVIVCFFLLLFLWWFSEKTRKGKTIIMVSNNPTTSEILGVKKDDAIGWSYFVGSLCAAFAGILIAANYNIIPKMGFNWLFPAIVAMIIGGTGRMRYLVLGALLLATAQHLAAYFLDSKWMNATAYIILIIFLCFRPYGFSGRKLKKTEV